VLKKFSVRIVMVIVGAALTAGQNCAPPAGNGGGGGGGGGVLAGVWQGQYNDSFVGPTLVTLTLQPNGNYTETYESASSYTYISGPYFQDFAGTPGLLRLQVLDWFPKEYLGTPIQPIAGESWFYTFINNNTLQVNNYYCTDPNIPGCTIVYTRVQ
jgi:hypothetical protein